MKRLDKYKLMLLCRSHALVLSYKSWIKRDKNIENQRKLQKTLSKLNGLEKTTRALDRFHKQRNRKLYQKS